MSLAVLSLSCGGLVRPRHVPKGTRVVEVAPAAALAAAAALDVSTLLVLEPDAQPSAQTFAAAEALDPEGGILGGCASEPGERLRFGSVFAAVPYGPYEIEPFPLVDNAAAPSSARPHADAIDAVSPGAYLVDRAAFVAIGGLDPTFGSPWRVYDLCARFRAAQRPVRWTPRLTFELAGSFTPPEDAIDHRDFVRRWATRFAARFDLETPARGGIRRAVRLPLGQRDVLMSKLPAIDVLLCGEGATAPGRVRESTHVRLASVRDLRDDGAGALDAFASALRSRADRYVAVVDAGRELPEQWLERMLVELEWSANVCAVRESGRTLLSLAKMPLDVQPGDATTLEAALSETLLRLEARAKVVRRSDGSARAQDNAARTFTNTPVSVVVAAHSTPLFHRTSFDGIYAGDLGVDYHVVVSPERHETIEALRTFPTLDVTIDDSHGMSEGINAAIARARGDIVVVIADDFYPPKGWIAMVREAHGLRPDAGVLGFSAVFVDGPQCVDTSYPDIKAFHAYAGERRVTMRREARLTDRLGALALSFDARALRAVGGFDKRLGAGRWGVEDIVLRMRCAGYNAYVTEDLFVHRFQYRDAQPLLNDPEDEGRRRTAFAEKWGLRGVEPERFDPAPLVARGFDPQRDFIAPEAGASTAQALRERYETVFVATCVDDASLENVAANLRRYLRAFERDEPVLFAVGVGGELELEAVSARARALVRKSQVGTERAADVAITALEGAGSGWIDALPGGRRLILGELDDLSPSGLRRAARGEAVAR